MFSLREKIQEAKAINPLLSGEQILQIFKLVCAASVPLCGVVSGMFAKSNRRLLPMVTAQTLALLSSQVAGAMNYPPVPAAGLAQYKVGVVELGGKYNQSDVDIAISKFGYLKSKVDQINLDGALPMSSDADGEVALDVQVIMGAAPGVSIVIATASNIENGIGDAVRALVAYGVDVIAVSWGAPEDQWTPAGIAYTEASFDLANKAKIPVLVASGDSGSDDGERFKKRTDYPASSSKVISCGGTSLTVNENGSRKSEVAWSQHGFISHTGSSGGGISKVIPLPDYQKPYAKNGEAGRMVPDIAANADPSTGYPVVVNGQLFRYGGTSAVAPLIAALIVRMKAAGKSISVESLYAVSQLAFFDVIEGGNGSYKAVEGYDCVTGRGVPDGTQLAALLK